MACNHTDEFPNSFSCTTGLGNTLSPALCLSLNLGIVPSPVRHCCLEAEKQQLKWWKTQDWKLRHKLLFKRCSPLQAVSSSSPQSICFAGFAQLCAQGLKSLLVFASQYYCRIDGLFKSSWTPVLSALGNVKIWHKIRLTTRHPLSWTQMGQKETWVPEDVAD